VIVLSSAFGAEAKEARKRKNKRNNRKIKLFDKWIEAKPRKKRSQEKKETVSD
jgi:hypothetical protein